MKVLIFCLFLLGCGSKGLVTESPSKVTILTATVEGKPLEHSAGVYFSDKLTEALLSDTIQVSNRSVVRAFEKSFHFKNRIAFSPKELEKLAVNFPSDYYVFTHIHRLYETEEDYEITVKLVNRNMETKWVHSYVFYHKEIYKVLNNAVDYFADLL